LHTGGGDPRNAAVKPIGDKEIAGAVKSQSTRPVQARGESALDRTREIQVMSPFPKFATKRSPALLKAIP